MVIEMFTTEKTYLRGLENDGYSVSKIDGNSIKITNILGGGVSINCIYYAIFSKVLCLFVKLNSLPLTGQPYANKLWKPWTDKKAS